MTNRRNAIKQMAMAAGMAFSAPTLMAMSRWETDSPLPTKLRLQFSMDAKELIGAVAEMIIPESDTPGAISAGVPAFVVMMLEDCYDEPEQRSFQEGLERLQKQGFMKMAPTVRHQTLIQVEKDAILEMKAFQVKQTKMGDNEDREQMKKQVTGLPFWRLIKELTLLGYFTSEKGIKASFDYVPVPGKFEITRLKPGQKSYAY